MNYLDSKRPCWLTLFAILVASAAAGTTATGSTKVDTSMCAKTDPVPLCLMKKSQCAPLDGLLATLLGTPDVIMGCVNITSVPIKPDYYASIGKALVTGLVGSLGKKPTSNPVANLAIRQCVLNATGMLGEDGSLDRGAVVSQVSLLTPPSLAAAVVTAATTCPEPASYKTTEFIKCLKKVCVASAPGAMLPAASPGGF
ncbi:uncharacterized protein LOC121853297 [Homarus americanus]|uniref:Secreted protein n=1 Tax=Homarus americanus TaxID=6706 RepID=A0A8J5JII9_HOMAM|nr:uncharacterized protein LOC121853297 [Homarus americanus]KAG7156836.1 hypothetical protein Hamer_G024057 [Homarus americanus]